jgi:hypothetical protein
MSSLRSFALRTAIISLAASPMNGCVTWQVQTVPPQQTLSDPRYVGKTVRLTTIENERVVVSDVQMEDGHIAGQEGHSPFTLPLAKVREVETKHFSAGRTLGLFVGAAAALGGALFIALAAQDDQS